MEPPCKNCTNRELGCHSSCPMYAEYRADITRRKKAMHDLYFASRAFADRPCTKRYNSKGDIFFKRA